MVQHKEALLLKWIVSVSSKEHSTENGALWGHINAWLASSEFKDLTQNDITNDDMFSIIQVIKIIKSNPFIGISVLLAQYFT